MTSEEQLDLWVEGKPIHNLYLGECCPDFSCCCPGLLAPQETREAFRKAYLANDNSTMTSMLSMFLGAAIDYWGKTQEVYIVGSEGPDSRHH